MTFSFAQSRQFRTVQMKIRIQFLDPGAIEIGAEDAHWNAPIDDEKTCAQINSAVNKFADAMGRMIVEIDTQTMTARVLEVAEHDNQER